MKRILSSVVRLKLPNINFEGVIPAKAGIQVRNTGFRVKPGMTIKEKGFVTRYTGYVLIILLLGLMISWIPEAIAEEKPRLIILPFFIERETVCPLCSTVFKKGEVLPWAQNTLTRLLYQKMEARGIFKTLPLEKVEEALSHRGRRIFEESPKSSSIELGRELGSDFIAIGFVFRFEERIGSSVGVERPASVGFDLHLIRLKDGVEVWRGRMDETQRPLSENLFKIGSFFRRKAHWLTAEELASVGMDEALRRLPGATELEEKK